MIQGNTAGMDNTPPTVEFNLFDVSNTRGNIYKMQLTQMHYNSCKHFYSNRTVAAWNSLPNIVVSAGSTNISKNRLDKLWINQDIKFDFCADIVGI